MTTYEVWVRRRFLEPRYRNKQSWNFRGRQLPRQSIHTIRWESLHWFRFWSRKLFFAYTFRRKTRFKTLRGRIQKIYIFEILIKFQFEIYLNDVEFQITCSRIACVLKMEFLRLHYSRSNTRIFCRIIGKSHCLDGS